MIDLLELHQKLGSNPVENSELSVRDWILLYRDKYYLGSTSNLKSIMLKEFHESPVGGHAGVQRTYIRLSTDFYLPGMKKDVQEFVGQCLICQSINYSTGKPFGLMQPTEIPQQIWEDVATDFIVGLPISKENTCIMVVDRLSKYAHFGPLPSSHSARVIHFNDDKITWCPSFNHLGQRSNLH